VWPKLACDAGVRVPTFLFAEPTHVRLIVRVVESPFSNTLVDGPPHRAFIISDVTERCVEQLQLNNVVVLGHDPVAVPRV
jgi:hypothetical protein